MASIGQMLAILDRAIAASRQARREEPYDCHLCCAWLPDPDVYAAREHRCTGCGALYVRLSGRWERALDEADPGNPYLSALYVRRYGYAPDYFAAIGWVVPKPWMCIRFPGDRVTPDNKKAAPEPGSSGTAAPRGVLR